MKKWLYRGVGIAPVVVPMLAQAGPIWCDNISNCVTDTCFIMNLAGCIGGWIVGPIL